MGGVVLDHRIHTAAKWMVLDERQERHQVVHLLASLRRRGRRVLTFCCGRRSCRPRRVVRSLDGLFACADTRSGRWGLRHRHGLACLGRSDPSNTALVRPVHAVDALDALGATRLLALGFFHRAPAHGPAHRDARDEDPSDVWHRLAPDETAFVEQPVVLTVELLEGVIGEDGRADLVGDGEHERVATTDGARRRSDEFVVGDGFVELAHLLAVDAMTEGGVDDHGDEGIGLLLHERHHRLVQLGEAR